MVVQPNVKRNQVAAHDQNDGVKHKQNVHDIVSY